MPARSDEPLAHLVTRIPKDLRRRLKVHCVEAGIQLQDFVTAAIREQLEGNGARRRGGSSA